eukprot:m.336644 g.336644  ORF g.336644 m.336644 type:complete len:385 (-) comp17912_c0_seq1:70-1224(-)
MTIKKMLISLALMPFAAAQIVIHSQSTATMSTESEPHIYKPAYCNDGAFSVASQNWGHMCHSIQEENPWVQLDYGSEKVINRVRIGNRQWPGNGVCRERVYCQTNCFTQKSDYCFKTCQEGQNCGYEIRVGNTPCNGDGDNCQSNTRCYFGDYNDFQNLTPDEQRDNMIEIQCDRELKGRYLQLILPGKSRSINLQEIQALNDPGYHTSTSSTGTSATKTTRTTVSTTTKTTVTNTALQLLKNKISATELALLAEIEEQLKDALEREEVLENKVMDLEDQLNETVYSNKDLTETVKMMADRLKTIEDRLMVSTKPSTGSVDEQCSLLLEQGVGCDPHVANLAGDNLDIVACCGEVKYHSKSCSVNPCDTQRELEELRNQILGPE